MFENSESYAQEDVPRFTAQRFDAKLNQIMTFMKSTAGTAAAADPVSIAWFVDQTRVQMKNNFPSLILRYKRVPPPESFFIAEDPLLAVFFPETSEREEGVDLTRCFQYLDQDFFQGIVDQMIRKWKKDGVKMPPELRERLLQKKNYCYSNWTKQFSDRYQIG